MDCPSTMRFNISRPRLKQQKHVDYFSYHSLFAKTYLHRYRPMLLVQKYVKWSNKRGHIYNVTRCENWNI